MQDGKRNGQEPLGKGKEGKVLQTPPRRNKGDGKSKEEASNAINVYRSNTNPLGKETIAPVLHTKMISGPPADLNRLQGAVVGSLVADAASQPLHWLYDDEVENLPAAVRIQRILVELGACEAPEFLTPSANPYYSIPTGCQSCYGDQIWVLLVSLVLEKRLDLVEYSKAIFCFFGSEGLKESVKSHFPHGVGGYGPLDCTETKGQQKPWRNTSIRKFLEKAKEPGDSKLLNSGHRESIPQMDGVVRIAPIVVAYHGTDKMLQRVYEMVRITVTHPKALCGSLAGALILSNIIDGDTRMEAVRRAVEQLFDTQRQFPFTLDDVEFETGEDEGVDIKEIVEIIKHKMMQLRIEVAEKLMAVLDIIDHDHQCVVEDLGLGCGLDNPRPNEQPELDRRYFCLQNAVHAVIKFNSFADAVRATMLIGGDCCARACFIGACFGAEKPHAIPESWLEKTLHPCQEFARRLGCDVRSNLVRAPGQA